MSIKLHKYYTIGFIIFSYSIWLFLNPYARTYFPFLIGSYIFAFYIFRNQHDEIKKIFDPKIWMHHTTLNEAYLIFITYAFISLFINNVYIFDTQTFVNMTVHLFKILGIQQITTEPTLLSGVLFIIASILAHDAGYYFAHRVQHKSKILWQFHKVHHSAEVMTPFTSLRQHPVEYVVNMLFGAVFMGITAAIFLYLYPSTATLHFVIQYQLAKVMFLTLGGALAHSHSHISYGVFDKYIISPAMHHVHHSENPKHYDKNFGFMLTCYDRIFGTIYYPDKKEKFTFGLGREQKEGYHTLKGALIAPFIRAWKILFQQRGGKRLFEKDLI